MAENCHSNVQPTLQVVRHFLSLSTFSSITVYVQVIHSRSRITAENTGRSLGFSDRAWKTARMVSVRLIFRIC